MGGEGIVSVSRWARLGRLGSKLAGSVVSQTVREAVGAGVDRVEAQRRRAEDLVEGLSRLKGAAMKVGQQAALLARHLDLPDDVAERLSRLNDGAEPVPFEVIRSTIEKTSGQELSELFDAFDEAPLGTASLAQAHAAVLPCGRDVVVKVLHPGIEGSVQADLLALRMSMVAGRAMSRSRAELDDLFGELRERLLEELDYAQEARNVAAFHELYGADPRFVVPQVHPEWSSDRVLVLDRVPGVSLSEFLRTASPEARQEAGLRLADLFFESAFRHRLLHADPHPGNFLFGPDGRVGVVDFGCVKRFPADWIGTYARLVLAALDRDDAAVLQATRDLGAWHGDDSEAADVILAFCDAVVAPLVRGPYRIDEADHMLQRVHPVVQRMLRFEEIRGHRHLLMLHRTLGGLYTVARQLGVTADWPARMRPHLQAAASAGEGAQ